VGASLSLPAFSGQTDNPVLASLPITAAPDFTGSSVESCLKDSDKAAQAQNRRKNMKRYVPYRHAHHSDKVLIMGGGAAIPM